MDSGNLEVQEASSAWVFGDAGGKQWVSGGARGKLGVQKESSWYLEVQEAGCVCLEAQDSKKNLYDDPFQTVPGSIPGSCIPAFTGTPSKGLLFKAGGDRLSIAHHRRFCTPPSGRQDVRWFL